MTHILSLAAGTLPEFDPATMVRAAGEAGFSHCGFTIDPENWDRQAHNNTKSEIAAHGLEILDVEVVWIPEGGQLGDNHRLIIDAGMELGAANVLVVSSEPDANKTADALHQLCEWAEPGQMRVALEFLMITAVQSLEQASNIVRLADHAAAALLVDSLHFQRAGHQPSELKSIEDELLPYTQLCDGNLECGEEFDQYLEDAIDLRSVPGEGELPVAEIVGVLPADIAISLEIRSKSYRERFPDPIARAKAVRDSSLRFFETIGRTVT